jgi:hypothetical protein
MPDFDFQPYLDFVQRHYSETQGLYTPTDAVLPLVEKNDRTSGEQENDLKSSQEPEQLPVLDGLWKYALGDDREHVLLAGRPGLGKSMALRQLVVALASEGQVPVLVQLKGDRSVSELIKAEFRRAKVRVTDDQINDWLFDDRLVLLLDGINEIPTEKLRQDLSQFREDNLSVPMVFTTRDFSIGGDLGIGKRFEMKPLSPEQLREFVGKYLPGQGERLLEQLDGGMREIAETPLLLRMLCDVFDPETEQIPSNKSELFEWFDRDYERVKKAVEYVPVSENFWLFKSQILHYLAFKTIEAGENKPHEVWYSFPRDRAANILEDWLRSRNMTDAPTKALLWMKDLVNCHLLQKSQNPDEIEFHHQLFQEYYAAKWLLMQVEKTINDQTLKGEYLNYLKWTEPIALLLGLCEEDIAIPIVKQALDVDLMLGARLAGEVRSEFNEKIFYFIHHEITLKNLPEWVQVEIWGYVGSDYAINELLKFLDRADIELVTRAAGFIGDTSNQNAIRIISNRFEKIDKIFSDQTTFGGIDNTHLVWMKHIQALRNINPRKFVSFLKEKLNTEQRNIIILMCNESIRWLVQLDKNTVKEMINLLKDSKDEDFKHDYILNILEVAKFDQNDIYKMLKIFEENSFEPIKIRIIDIICKTDFDFLGDELVKIISLPSNEVSYKLRDEVSKNIISRSINKLDVDSLEGLLFNCDFEVRYFAAIILGSTGNLLAIPVLISSMCLDDPWIRRKTIRIFHYIKEEKIIIPLLRHYLQDLDPVICREAAFSLSYFGRNDGLHEIILALGQSPLETYYKSICSLGRLNHREPLWELIHRKRSEAEYAQFGHWQPVAIELLKLGDMDVFPEICETLLNLNYQSSTEVMNLVAKYADISTVDWLIKVLAEPQTHRIEPYALNRIALTLRRIPVEIIQQRIMQLSTLFQKTHIHQLSWLLPELQSRINFYNYEIEKQAEELRKADRASLDDGRDDPYPNIIVKGDYIAGDKIQGDKIGRDKYDIDRVGNLNTETVNIHGNQNGEQ